MSIRMGTIAALVLASAQISAGNAADSYTCRDDRGSRLGLRMDFEGTKLTQIEVVNLPFKNAKRVEKYQRSDLDSAKFGYYRINITDIADIDEAYVTVTFKNRRTVENSILGNEESESGLEYGKVRVDLSFEAALEDYGSTYFMECERD